MQSLIIKSHLYILVPQSWNNDNCLYCNRPGSGFNQIPPYTMLTDNLADERLFYSVWACSDCKRQLNHMYLPRIVDRIEYLRKIYTAQAGVDFTYMDNAIYNPPLPTITGLFNPKDPVTNQELNWFVYLFNKYKNLKKVGIRMNLNFDQAMNIYEFLSTN